MEGPPTRLGTLNADQVVAQVAAVQLWALIAHRPETEGLGGTRSGRICRAPNGRLAYHPGARAISPPGVAHWATAAVVASFYASEKERKVSSPDPRQQLRLTTAVLLRRHVGGRLMRGRLRLRLDGWQGR
jgi:hypothetical protein